MRLSSDQHRMQLQFRTAAAVLVLATCASSTPHCCGQASDDVVTQTLISSLGSECAIEFSLNDPGRFNAGLKGVRGIIRQDGSTQLTVAAGTGRDVAVRILNVDAAQREGLFLRALQGARRFRLAEERPSPETNLRMKLSAGTAEVEIAMDDSARADVVLPIAWFLNDLLPADERVAFPGRLAGGLLFGDPIKAVDRLPLRLPEQPLVKRLPEKWDLSLRIAISRPEEIFVQASSNGEVFLDDKVIDLSAKSRRLNASKFELRQLFEGAIDAAQKFEFMPPSHAADPPSKGGCLLKIRSRYPMPNELSTSSWIRIEERDAAGNPNFEASLLEIRKLVDDTFRSHGDDADK